MSILRIEPNAINPGSSYTFGNVEVTGNITVTGSILPTSNNAVNLGDPTHRFGTLYLAANTIDLGGAQISATDGNISISGFGGNIDFTSNVVEFLSNVSVQGPQGAIGYTGSRGVDGVIGYTGSQGIMGYTGSAGTGGGDGSSSVYSRTAITATAGQTSFNVAYNIGYIQVYFNGVLLSSSDYTANNGTTVVLIDPAEADDLVEFVTYNMVPIAEIQNATFNSTTMTANLAITAGYSAVSVGPMAIADGVTVSIASGQKWVIL